MPGGLAVLQRGTRGTVVAVGPMLDPVLEAVSDLDVTVLYATTVRPFDADTLLGALDDPRVVLVEPYLAGTSVPQVNRIVADRHPIVDGIGVSEVDLHRYGSRTDHDLAHGLDPRSLRHRIGKLLR